MLSCEKTGKYSAKKKPYNENILRYDVNAPFTSLDPVKRHASGSNHVLPLMYNYLFVPNINGSLEPDLASTWVYDPETLTWTIHLKKNALFHNGRPVTSKDAKYSIEAHLKNEFSSLFSLIEKISISSDAAFNIGLKKHDPEFLRKLWDVEIVPQPNGDKIDYYNHPIGSGPFKFAYRKGKKEIGLVANKAYHDAGPYLDGAVFYYQPDREKTWTRILAGKTDVAQEIMPKNYQMMKQYQREFYFDCYTVPSYTILLYNTTVPPFLDPNVRLALAYAIDREYIVEKILKGFGVVAVGPLGVDSPSHNPKLKPIPYNPHKGLTLLNEACWFYDEEGHYLTKNGERFEFTIFLFEEYQIEKKVAQYIRICLNDLGIKVHLQSLPYQELIGRYRRNTDFQAVITEFTTAYRDPEWLRELWAPEPHRNSRGGCFEHPQVSRLIEEAISEKDPMKQKELLYEIDALITSLQPGTFLFHKVAIGVMSKRLKTASPFSLRLPGVWRLRHVSLNQN